MYELRYETECGVIYYKKTKDDVTVTSYRGTDTRIEIPEYIDDLPVTTIGKKAFMNTRQCKLIHLPDSVEQLEDWSLAYCPALEKVILPRKRIAVGSGVFLGSNRLERIIQEDALNDDISFLLAMLPTMKDGELLLDFSDTNNKEWIGKWDNRLQKILDEPDEKGFTQMILCGEEDINCTIENYVREKRKNKVRYTYLRLLHPYGLSAEMKLILENYLKMHSVGSDSEEAWLVLKEEKGHERAYYELYVSLGCLNEDNYDNTLLDLAEQQPEMKAYFLRWKEQIKLDAALQEDPFSAFSL